jgi:hypothetical protein
MALKKLSHRHLEIARQLLLGCKQREIAKQFKLSETYISRITRSEIFRTHMLKLQDQADAAVMEQKLRRYEEIALRKLAMLKNPGSTTGQKLGAAASILGRVR